MFFVLFVLKKSQAMKDSEDLKLLLSGSRTLLESCYEAREGFREGTRCRAFAETYPEVCVASNVSKRTDGCMLLIEAISVCIESFGLSLALAGR